MAETTQNKTQTTHYFSSPTGDFEPQEVRARFWDEDWTFFTAPGVFSGHGLDIGTSVLLRSCPPPAGPGTVLDLGCGFGLISVALAVANPELEIVAIDVNERALALTRMNAEHHGVSNRVRVYLADQVPADLVFDEIWSNPPIRIGKTALHDLLTMWLARLAPDGCAKLVVGKNLGADSLQRWITEQPCPPSMDAHSKASDDAHSKASDDVNGKAIDDINTRTTYSCERLASAKGFRVFEVRR